MKIVIYSPSNLRAVDQQSQALLFQKMGHQPVLLTCLPEGVLHKNFQSHGFQTYSSDIRNAKGVKYFLKEIQFLIKFCNEHNIDVVCCHLQSCALIAGVAKFFMKSKVVYMRHHTDFVGIYNSPKERLQNCLANTLSPKIIAISDTVNKILIKENVPHHKIHRINLCYDFGEYRNDFTEKADVIKTELRSPLTLLYVARLDPVKRHTYAFKIVEDLLAQNVECKLFCIGKGSLEGELNQYIADKKLGEHIIMKGFVTNVFDYISAADIVLLLSDTEASSHMLKETGLCGKSLIACAGVGDFNDYIIHGENGYLVNKENPIPETVKILKMISANKHIVPVLGENLKKTVYKHFSIDSNFESLYSDLFKAMKIQL